MTGIELARAYYEEFGRAMLEKEFGRYTDRIAAGLVGHGSECFGYDDAVSRDHDYEPGFCLWLTEEDEREFGFRLFRAYSKLPREYHGVKNQNRSVLGSQFKGVHTIGEFYTFYTGCEGAPRTMEQWLSIPEFYLAEATNGEVFDDPLGHFTRIRQEILTGRPRDVRLKKLASSLFYMAQAGQYNYSRCMAHGERGAAALALSEFVKNAASAVFLLNDVYEPYYKWVFRAMKELPVLGDCALQLEELLSASCDAEKNKAIIEALCSRLIQVLVEQGLAEPAGDYLEPYAYGVNDRIGDGILRNQPVML
ncbi:MAG: DUF4037 domain-containing protein [Lachnospiraceae bacterium]|jgi:hypothetical protein|nr:DUF4037 domain-containing protein [Lachnospiraceae bacterium]MCI9150908.1 DUF4037 domain-containing protein [Lachnospiraceae bacterium]